MIIQDPQDFFSSQTSKSRLLGIDMGTKTIGLALSDTRWVIATPLITIARQKFSRDVQILLKLIQEHQIVGLILGLPLNMDGSEGPRCQSTKQFAKNLEVHCPLPLLLWDERLSTVAVTRTLLEADMSRKRRREVVDKMAASFILQGILDYLCRHKERNI